MELSTAIVKDAMAPYELKNLAAKIVTISILPFLLIAAFEAIVINGGRLIANVVIIVLNSFAFLFEDDPVAPPPSLSQPMATSATSPRSPAQELLPVTDPHKKMIAYVVDTLARARWYTIAFSAPTLLTYKTKLLSVHPLAFLGTIFSNPTIKANLSLLYANGYGNDFVEGLETNIQRPEHMAQIDAYIPLFCRKLNQPQDQIERFLKPTRNWQALISHLLQ